MRYDVPAAVSPTAYAGFMSHDVIGIDALLAELGYAETGAHLEARHAIEAAGLTNPRKRNILRTKREAVESALAERLALVCGDARCLKLAAADTRPHVRVQRPACQFCGGRPTPTAVREMAAALVDNGRPRLLVVGGSPQSHAELRRLLVGTPVDLRLVEGTVAVSEKRADAWAD